MPSVFKNTQRPGGSHGLPFGQAGLHGGIDGTISVAAYAFPTTGLYHVSGAFGAGDSGRVDETVSLNGVVLGAYTHLDDAAGFAFSFDVPAIAGGSLAFSVGIGTTPTTPTPRPSRRRSCPFPSLLPSPPWASARWPCYADDASKAPRGIAGPNGRPLRLPSQGAAIGGRFRGLLTLC